MVKTIERDEGRGCADGVVRAVGDGELAAEGLAGQVEVAPDRAGRNYLEKFRVGPLCNVFADWMTNVS